MLNEIVNIIINNKYIIEDGTIFFKKYKISSPNVIKYLESGNILENIIDVNQIDVYVDLEMSLARLNAVGIYETCNMFITKNKYKIPNYYYILEIKCFNTEPNEFINKYKSIVNLIISIQNNAKYSYTETDTENSILFREDKSLFIPLRYTIEDINLINSNNIKEIYAITSVLNEEMTEKKLLYINEFIDFTIKYDETNRFSCFLKNINIYCKRCNDAYQYYLTNFSYNKLKIELDAKALDYTQKIQSTINESQTKLIAIPSAFVLVFSTFDFNILFSVKNIASILGLFIFAILIQLFLNNQKSSLYFINENINSYKDSFKDKYIYEVSERFNSVEKELYKQKTRLLIVEVLLWLIPILLFAYCLFIYYI